MDNIASSESISVSPSKPLVVYDGECRFCIARVGEIRKLDTANAMDYMPRQDEQCEQRFPAIRDVDLEDGILFIEADGKISVAADAIYKIFRLLPERRLVAQLYLVPGIKQMIRLGYRIIAINRRRLGQTCEGGVCMMHEPKK